MPHPALEKGSGQGTHIKSRRVTAAPCTQEGQQSRHTHSPTGCGYSSPACLLPCDTVFNSFGICVT